MKKTIVAAGAALVCASLFAMPSTEPTDRLSTDFWAKRHAAKMALAKAGGSKVVFIGDSITHNWENNGKGRQQWDEYFAGEPYKALNLGYSGDRTEHVLWRIANGELDGYEAKVIVLMIGTNNVGFRMGKESVIDTIAGVWRVIQAIRAKQPKARIILHPIFPCGEKPNDYRRVHNEKVNKELRKFADGRKVIWIDFNDALLEPDGTLPAEVMPDFLHPRAYGYEVWAAAVKPAIDWALAAKEDDFYPNRYPSALRKGVMSGEKRGALRMCSCIGEKHSWDPGPNWWLERLAAKQEEIHALPNGEVDIIFVGDSITHNWEGARGPGSDPGGKRLAEFRKTYSVLGLGFGGDGTEQVLWRLSNGELDGYRTKCVMLMVGTNNGGKPEETAAGIRAILDLIARKQPQAKTLLLSIFPSGEKPDHPWRVRNMAVNALIRPFADGGKVIWVDFGAKFLQPGGTISKDMMGDFLHPKEPGYDIWADAVAPYFKEVVGR